MMRIDLDNVEILRRKIGIKKELIDINIRKSLAGLWAINGILYKNRLLKNYYELIYTLLGGGTITCVDTTGYGRNFNAEQYKITYDRCQIHVGTDTEDLPFNGHVLTSYGASVADTVEALAQEDYSETVVGGTAPKNGSIVGICGRLNDSTNHMRTILLNDVLLSVSSGDPLSIHLKFYEPWVYNIAVVWRGWLEYSNPTGTKDIAGVNYQLRCSGGITVGEDFEIALGDGTEAWSPTDYTLTNARIIDTIRRIFESDSGIEILLRAWYIPAEDESIPELGLIGKLYDVGGSKYDTLLARIALETNPISLTANHLYIIRMKILAT